MGNRPPIGKYNHVYADVLLPQTDEEHASNEYTYPQLKVSSIPNTHFAMGLTPAAFQWILPYDPLTGKYLCHYYAMASPGYLV
jgi:hypothetical protein